MRSGPAVALSLCLWAALAFFAGDACRLGLADRSPVVAHTCDLPEPDVQAQLNSLRCALIYAVERNCREKRREPDGRLVTRCLPERTPWRGWPWYWNRCERCDYGPECNRGDRP